MNYVRFLLIACFWGGSFVAIQPLVQAVPPFLAGALRMAIAVVFLGSILPLLRAPYQAPRELRPRIWATGIVAFGIPFSLLFWGERTVSPGLAGIVNGTVPIWVFILGLVFTPGAEKATLRKIGGLLLGICGVVAIFYPKIVATESDPSIWGLVAVVVMAISYGASVLLNRTLFSRYPKLSPFTNLFQQLVAGFLALLVVSLVVEGIPHPSLWHPISLVVATELYLGCISTSIAFMLFYQLIQAWGSVRAATVTYIVPAVALFFDLLLNRKVPSASELLGVCFVTAGIVILNFPRRVSSS